MEVDDDDEEDDEDVEDDGVVRDLSNATSMRSSASKSRNL